MSLNVSTNSCDSCEGVAHYVARLDAESPKVKIVTPKIRTHVKGTTPVAIVDGHRVPLRRSGRNKLRRLDHAIGQRVIYQTDAEGNQTIAGVTKIEYREKDLTKYNRQQKTKKPLRKK
jgi:hypothetical protein